MLYFFYLFVYLFFLFSYLSDGPVPDSSQHSSVPGSLTSIWNYHFSVYLILTSNTHAPTHTCIHAFYNSLVVGWKKVQQEIVETSFFSGGWSSVNNFFYKVFYIFIYFYLFIASYYPHILFTHFQFCFLFLFFPNLKCFCSFTTLTKVSSPHWLIPGNSWSPGWFDWRSDFSFILSLGH